MIQVDDYGVLRRGWDVDADEFWDEYLEFGADENEAEKLVDVDGSEVLSHHVTNLENPNGKIMFQKFSSNYIFDEKAKEVKLVEDEHDIAVYDSTIYNGTQAANCYYTFDSRCYEANGNYFVNFKGKEIALGSLGASTSSNQLNASYKVSYIKDANYLNIHIKRNGDFKYNLVTDALESGGILVNNVEEGTEFEYDIYSNSKYRYFVHADYNIDYYIFDTDSGDSQTIYLARETLETKEIVWLQKAKIQTKTFASPFAFNRIVDANE